MRRSHLVWFAAGAATSAFVSIVASLIFAREPEPGPFLMVEDRLDLLLAEADPREVGTFSGRMLRECGAQTFEMEAPYPDGGGYSLLPITEDNAPAFDCVFKRSTKEGFVLDVWMTKRGQAQEP